MEYWSGSTCSSSGTTGDVVWEEFTITKVKGRLDWTVWTGSLWTDSLRDTGTTLDSFLSDMD